MELGTKEFNDSAMEMFGGKPKQQTAVEWLVEQIISLQSKDLKLSEQYDKKLIEQAKEMEKQQQDEFAIDLLARNNKNYIALPDLAEQYYNETFNK